MNSIDSVQGKLFYAVYQMFKESMIDGRGKVMLKDLIILNNPHILAAYDQYQKNGTELTLRTTLFNIYSREREAEKAEGLSDRSRKSRGFKVKEIIVPPRIIQKIPQHIRPS